MLDHTITRRKFLKSGVALAGAGVCGGVAIYEPHELSVERLDIHLRRLPEAFDRFCLVQISDIHFGDWLGAAHLQKVVDASNAATPDLVIVTGDFVSAPLRASNRNAAAQLAWPCAQVLQGLRARYGVLATLGNHDVLSNPWVVGEALHANGIRLLRNKSVPIEVNRARLWISGVDDVLETRPRPELALRNVARGETVIAAVHEPDYADVMQFHDVDFQISGPSHGGQIRLPLLGAPYLPELARKYPWGYRRVGPLQLYTNRGVGVIHIPFRFMAPPELTVFTLRVAAASTPMQSSPSPR